MRPRPPSRPDSKSTHGRRIRRIAVWLRCSTYNRALGFRRRVCQTPWVRVSSPGQPGLRPPPSARSPPWRLATTTAGVVHVCAARARHQRARRRRPRRTTQRHDGSRRGVALACAAGTSVSGATPWARAHRGCAARHPGKALRQALILRALAVERWIRAVLIAFAAWAVWTFHVPGDRSRPRWTGICRCCGPPGSGRPDDGDRRVGAGAGGRPSTPVLISLALVAYAILELVEGVGLLAAHQVGRVLRRHRDVGLPAVGDLRPRVEGHHDDAGGRLHDQRGRRDLPADVQTAVRPSWRTQGVRRGTARRAALTSSGPPLAHRTVRAPPLAHRTVRAGRRSRIGLCKRAAARSASRAPRPACRSAFEQPHGTDRGHLAGTRRCPVPCGTPGTGPGRRRSGRGTRRGSPGCRRRRPTGPAVEVPLAAASVCPPSMNKSCNGVRHDRATTERLADDGDDVVVEPGGVERVAQRRKGVEESRDRSTMRVSWYSQPGWCSSEPW